MQVRSTSYFLEPAEDNHVGWINGLDQWVGGRLLFTLDLWGRLPHEAILRPTWLPHEAVRAWCQDDAMPMEAMRTRSVEAKYSYNYSITLSLNYRIIIE